ncbi:MAG: FtsQ-type POTRA domain-containing protein [Lentisphaeria bacterium]|nr:FtsQ-type POTRA domain-containing protein [Lentisphaeria bacterium]
MTSPQQTSPKNKQTGQGRKKLLGAGLAVLSITLLLGAAAAGIYGARKALFVANPRLVLREIRVSGAGYWKEHPDALADAAGLRIGTGLFSLDLRKIRRRILDVPNVDSCSVVRVLPDLLVIKVTERVPRAVLGRAGSPWVVDGESVVMSRAQVMDTYRRLPVITGVPTANVKAGTAMKELKSAMELVMMTVRSFPDITVYQISLADPRKLDVLLRYRRFPVCRVAIPVKNRGMSFMLLTLQSAIINARRTGETRNHYDLSYDGRVVIH